MPRIKLNQSINANGIVTTAAELLDSGKAIVERVEHFGRNDVTKYMLVLLNDDGTPSDGYFEIGQKAYESRVLKGQHILPARQLIAKPEARSIAFENGVLTVGSETFNPVWHDESESWELSLRVQNDSTPSILKALQDHMQVFNWDTSMYGEWLIINFDTKEQST